MAKDMGLDAESLDQINTFDTLGLGMVHHSSPYNSLPFGTSAKPYTFPAGAHTFPSSPIIPFTVTSASTNLWGRNESVNINLMLARLSLQISASIGIAVHYVIVEKLDGLRLSLSLVACVNYPPIHQERILYEATRVSRTGELLALDIYDTALNDLVETIMLGGLARVTRQAFDFPEEVGV